MEERKVQEKQKEKKDNLVHWCFKLTCQGFLIMFPHGDKVLQTGVELVQNSLWLCATVKIDTNVYTLIKITHIVDTSFPRDR